MRRVQIWMLLVLLLMGTVSCFRDPDFEPGFSGGDNGGRELPERSYSRPARRVMIMVSAGFNSLSGYLAEDLEELENGYLPTGTYYNSDVLLVLSRTVLTHGDYSHPNAPVLYRLYKDMSGEAQKDTLLRWSEDTQLSKGETLGEALNFVQRKFPAGSYGMVFSSHASGWLPEGYYNDPSEYEKASSGAFRSLGQDADGKGGGVEMELQEFVDAIPFPLDYLLIDACLCGCVEVAHAFKDKAHIVGFSPTEVLANGFNYLKIASFLLEGDSDPIGVCQEYFAYYDAQSGSNRSATVSVVDTREMDPLVSVCRELFEKYRTKLKTLDGNRVQGYFRFERHYFYDLKDILVKAGITSEEEARLDAALDACILYKAATPQFLSIPIRRYSGLSMYLPSMGSSFLDNFYRTQISWNDATNLVK